jgi:UDP-glucose 4-epimerase
MNILITGGAGFIASHIANAYLKENHHVVILDNLSSGDREAVPPKAVFYQMDLLDPSVPEIIKKEKIDVINHHAAQISVYRSVLDPVFDANSNIIGTLQLLQGAIKCHVKKFIFASTGGAIYGEQDYFPACENHPCKPLSPYAVAKLSVEKYLLFYERNFNLKSTVFRYSNVYGPGQKTTGEAGVVAIYCEKLVKNSPPVIYGTGEQTRDFISVRDVVQANLIALKPECCGIFNIGTGSETSVNELSGALIKLAGGKIKAEFGPSRVYEQLRSSIDAKKFSNEFGWKPRLTLEEGLFETLEYFKNKHNGNQNK